MTYNYTVRTKFCRNTLSMTVYSQVGILYVSAFNDLGQILTITIAY